MSAQSNPQGVPKELLEAKKLELIQEKVGPPPPDLYMLDDVANYGCQIDAEKAAEQARRRTDQ